MGAPQAINERLGSRQQWRNRIGGWPDWLKTAAMILPALAIATLLRVINLAGSPPGFRPAEATSALFAKSIGREQTPIFFTGTGNADEPLFFYLVRLTGDIAGWGVAGPRLAAAICGIVAVAGCALWFRATLGRPWALVGGLLVATSFWQIVVSRQAVEPVAAAALGAVGLWCLWEAIERGNERHSAIWFLAAGGVLGLGFYTDVAFRPVLIAVPIVCGFLIWSRRKAGEQISIPGIAVGLAAMLAVALPMLGYYVQHPDDFWRGLDVAGGLPESLPAAGRNDLLTLQTFVWDGAESPVLNLPGRPLLDPVLAVWTVAGLAVALRHPLRSLHGLALLWTVIFLLPAALLSPEDPGLLLAATPAVFLFPLLGMRFALQWFKDYRAQVARAGVIVIVLSIGVSAGWSIYDYFWSWSSSEATYRAFHGDVRESLAAVDDLPNPELPVYFVDGDDERIVRYLAPDHPRRDITSPSAIPIPAKGGAYLAYPARNAPDPALMSYIEEQPLVRSGGSVDGGSAYHVWLLDVRLRERLPYVVPAIPFNNGYTLLGYDISAAPGSTAQSPALDVVLAWEVPAGGDPYTLSARFTATDARDQTVIESAEAPIIPTRPGEPVERQEIILVHLRMPFPQTADLLADLGVALINPADGTAVQPVERVISGDGGYVVLNRIALEPEGP